jgi:hypothetical protein
LRLAVEDARQQGTRYWQKGQRIVSEILDETALSLEFDVLAKRAGLDIPADRRPAVLAGFKELRHMLALLRQPRSAAHEPAGTYSILSVTRGIE